MSKPSIQAQHGGEVMTPRGAGVSTPPPAQASGGNNVGGRPQRDTGPTEAMLLRELRDLKRANHLMEAKLRGIEAISKSLVSEHNLERILEAVLTRTTGLVQADRATLYLLDNDNQTMWSTVALGEELETIQLKVGQGIAGWVAKHGRPVNVKDAYLDPRFDQNTDKVTNYRTKSVLAWPLTNSRQQTIGVIQCLNKADGYFTPADEDLLEAIASQAAITIQNSKLYLDIVGKNIDLLETQMRLRSRKRELELLIEVERATAHAAELDEALGGVAEVVSRELPAEGVAVALYERYRDELVVHAASGPGADNVCGTAIPTEHDGDETVWSTAFGGTTVSLTNEAAREALGWWLAHVPTASFRSLAAIPVRAGKTTLGVLILVNRSGEARTFDSDTRVLESVAGRIGMAWELIETRKEEEQAARLAAVGQTLSSVIHDLKTPLTIINGYAQMLAKEEAPERRADFKERIQRQIAQIKVMTQEVLSFARGDSTVLLRKVFVDSFFAELKETLSKEFEGSSVALSITPTYRGGVKMDEDKMKRVVFNLARNAREALAGREGRFDIGVEEVDGRVVFRFSDDGPGIPEEMRGRLFESFATHGKKHGTGLGLAIVKKIVEEHHGHIDVESTPGQGTTFYIALPKA